MSDKLFKERLGNILQHIAVIEKRFSSITHADDFVCTNEGVVLLDAITIRLQAIGENITKVRKRNPEFIEKYPQIEWEDIVHFRNFISHNYEILDFEIVFTICQVHIPKLKEVVAAELKLLRK